MTDAAAPPPPARGSTGSSERVALWPYYLVVFLVTSGFGVVFTMLGELRDEFGLSDLGVGVIASAGFFAGLVSQLALARYADRGHALVMIRLGLVFAVASMAMMTFGETLFVFIASRGLLGIGAGLIFPAARRIVIATDPAHVGTNIGRLGSADIAGFAFGPALAAVLVELGGVRAPFVALGLIIAVAFPFASRAAVDVGEIDEERRSMRSLLRYRSIVAMIVVSVGFFLMIGTFDAVWALLLTDRGAETWLIGLTITIFALPMVVIAPVGGRLAQRRGPLRTAALGLILAVPCVLSYGVLGTVLALSVVVAIQSLFDAITFPATQVGVAMASPPEQLAAAQGLLGATELASAGTMALIAGMVYDAGGAGPTFALTGALMIVCVVAGLAIGGGRLRPASELAGTTRAD